MTVCQVWAAEVLSLTEHVVDAYLTARRQIGEGSLSKGSADQGSGSEEVLHVDELDRRDRERVLVGVLLE